MDQEWTWTGSGPELDNYVRSKQLLPSTFNYYVQFTFEVNIQVVNFFSS